MQMFRSTFNSITNFLRIRTSPGNRYALGFGVPVNEWMEDQHDVHLHVADRLGLIVVLVGGAPP
jgi:hypothetical protein